MPLAASRRIQLRRSPDSGRAHAARGQNDWTRATTRAWILVNRPGQHDDLNDIPDALESLDRSTVVWARSRTPSLVLEVPVADGQTTYPL